MKANGIKYPGGRPKKRPGASADPVVRRAQRLLNQALPVPVASSEIIPADQARAERLNGLGNQSLDVIQMVFDLPLPESEHPNFMKLVSAKKDAALSILSLQLRLPPPNRGDWAIAEIQARIRKFEEEEALAAARSLDVTPPKPPKRRNS